MAQIFGCNFLRRHKQIMSLATDPDFISVLFEFEQGNHIVSNELSANRSAYQFFEPRSAKGDILLDLNTT